MPAKSMPQKSTTEYADYLKLDDLLSTQQPLSDHPDELHFIIVHQVHELWFKLALHHLTRARAAIVAGQFTEAVRLVDQVTAIMDNLISTTEHLHSLPAEAFHRFRALLAPGSGLQSYQFRELEFIAGRRDEAHIAWVRRVLGRDDHLQHVEARLAEPSLAEVLDSVLAQQGIVPVDIYTHPDNYPALYALCEALSEFDHRVVRWRFTHIQLVERTIGTGTTGTGGTTHDYLQRTLSVKLFPTLWAARDALTLRINETGT